MLDSGPTLMPSDHGEQAVAGALVLALGVAAVLGAWFPRSPEPLQSWDQATHLLLAADYRDAWVREGLPAWQRLREVSSFYPPFYHGCVAALFALVGPSSRAAGLFGGAMLLVLALGTGLVARRLLGGPAAPTAAAFVLAAPAFAALATQPLVDLTLAALVTLAVACTLAPRFLGSSLRAAAFGLLLACGLLTKWVFPAFVVGPILWRLVKGPKVPAARWAIAALVALAVAGAWYAPNAADLLEQARTSAAAGRAEGDPAGLSLRSLAYYPLAVVMFFSLPLRLLLVAAAVLAIRSRWRRERGAVPASSAWPIAIWLAVPLVVFTAIDNKDPRYIAPAAPALAVLAAAALAALPSARARDALLAAIAVHALAIHALVWRSAHPERAIERALGTVPAVADLVSLDVQAFTVPDPDGWPVRDVVARIRGGLTAVAPRASLAVVPDLPYLNAATFRWAAYQAGYRLEAFHPDATPSLAEYSLWEYALVKPQGRQGTPHATRGSEALTADVMSRRDLLPPVWAFGSREGPVLLVRTRHSAPPSDLRPRDGRVDLQDPSVFWHLGEGWSFREPWGRWATGGHAVLRVQLPAGVAQRVTVSLAPPDALVAQQVVTVRFGGRRLRSFRLDRAAWDWDDVAMELPSGLASGGIDTLSLAFSRSVPAAGADAARELSAAVRFVRFEPLP